MRTASYAPRPAPNLIASEIRELCAGLGFVPLVPRRRVRGLRRELQGNWACRRDGPPACRQPERLDWVIGLSGKRKNQKQSLSFSSTLPEIEFFRREHDHTDWLVSRLQPVIDVLADRCGVVEAIAASARDDRRIAARA